MQTYLSTGGVARMANVYYLTALHWVKRGWLKPDAKTEAGRLLFRPEHVREFLAKRTHRRASRGGSA